MNTPESKDVNIKVILAEDKTPDKIQLSGSDMPEARYAKGMFLSLFDPESKETLKIDLWTKDMQVMEMDRFMFQTLRGLAETYHKATRNTELAEVMQQFVTYFGEITEIIPKKSN